MATSVSEWECKQCTFHNPSSTDECSVCKTDRHNDEKKWQCQNCTFFTPEEEDECIFCECPCHGLNQGDIGQDQRTERCGATGGVVTESGNEPFNDGVQESNTESSSFMSDKMWLCKKDGCCTWNQETRYRCTSCDAIKPYFLTEQKPPIQEDEPWQRPDNFKGPSVNDDRTDGTHLMHVRRYGGTLPTEDFSEDFAHLYLSGTASPETATKEYHEQPTQDGRWETDEEVLKFPDSECRMMLVGKTGHGKSSTGNTILGLHKFQTGHGFESTTKMCQRHIARRFGIHLEVADTPGLLDTDLDEDIIMKEIARCLGIISPGPHAVVVVVRIGTKFTAEEAKSVAQIRSVFGVQLLRHMVIVFTHGDQLGDCSGGGDFAAVKAMIESSPDALKELVREANNQYVVFNNKASSTAKSSQVKQLITMIIDLLKVNGGHPYTSKLLEQVEARMQERESNILRDLHGRHSVGQQGEIAAGQRRQARDIARDELAIGDSSLLQQILKELLPCVKPVIMQFLHILATHAARRVIDGGCSIL